MRNGRGIRQRRLLVQALAIARDIGARATEAAGQTGDKVPAGLVIYTAMGAPEADQVRSQLAGLRLA
jgi:hypothetical protein